MRSVAVPVRDADGRGRGGQRDRACGLGAAAAAGPRSSLLEADRDRRNGSTRARQHCVDATAIGGIAAPADRATPGRAYPRAAAAWGRPRPSAATSRSATSACRRVAPILSAPACASERLLPRSLEALNRPAARGSPCSASAGSRNARAAASLMVRPIDTGSATTSGVGGAAADVEPGLHGLRQRQLRSFRVGAYPWPALSRSRSAV